MTTIWIRYRGNIGRQQPPSCVKRAIGRAAYLAANDFDGVTAERYGYVNRTLPDAAVAQKLRSGALKALDVGYGPKGADLNIAYPRERTTSAKLLALMRHA